MCVKLVSLLRMQELLICSICVFQWLKDELWTNPLQFFMMPSVEEDNEDDDDDGEGAADEDDEDDEDDDADADEGDDSVDGSAEEACDN